MQSNSEKQNNNYSSESVYPSYQTSVLPPYPGYPQQPTGGFTSATANTSYTSQAPLHQQKSIVVPLARRNVLNDKVPIPITTSLKIFLLLSGFTYSLWGIISLSIHIAIIINSYSTYYYGFFTGFFLIFGGIMMMIIGLRSSSPLASLVRIYTIDLVLCIMGLTSAIASYELSNRCLDAVVWYCDDNLGRHLKISHIIIFSLAVIHTVINISYMSTEQKKAISRSNANVLNY